MRRREFLGGLAGAAATWPLAAAWPLATLAQQRATPVVGFLNPASADSYAHRMRGFHRGLKEQGFVEGENIALEYRWGDNRSDRLVAMAADLVRRRVSVIVTGTGPATPLAAKAATTTIPIVFVVSGDPVGLGLVSSLARPNGNLTGVNFLNLELLAKRLAVLRDIVPGARRAALLIDMTAGTPDQMARDVEEAASGMALKVQVFRAAAAAQIDEAFAKLADERPDILFVTGGPLFNARRLQLAMLAVRHGIIASYASRDYPEAGGLMSYGTDVTDAFRQAGIYAGRILKGAKPADLPVVQATKFELVINRQTARTIGVIVPQSVLVAADEVIE
jgi:putative ABC transport system substrate-binding protein